MGKHSPQTPAAPDPAATAAAQSQTSRDTAYWNAVLNNVNQVTPYGSLTYSQTGGGPRYDDAGYQRALDNYQTSLAAYNSTPNTVTNSPVSNNFGWGGSGPMSKSTTSSRGPAPVAPNYQDFKIGDGPPQFTATTRLSDAEQAKLDLQNKNELALLNMGSDQLGRINQSVSTPFSYDGLPKVFGEGDTAEAQKRAEDAIYSRLDPKFAQDDEALRTRLINQGIGQGSDAYKKEFDTLNQAKNDARMQAVLSGQQYASALLGDSLTRRNQGIQEYTTQRNAPLNEYIALTNGTQVQNPQFQNINYQGAQAPDYASLVNNQYQSQIAANNAKIAQNNATSGALFSLGGAAASGFLGSPSASAAISKRLFG